MVRWESLVIKETKEKLDLKGIDSHPCLYRQSILRFKLHRPQGFKGDVGPIGVTGIQGEKGDKVIHFFSIVIHFYSISIREKSVKLVTRAFKEYKEYRFYFIPYDRYEMLLIF